MVDIVKLSIPDKREIVLSTGMSELQKRYYKAVLTKNAAALGAGNPRSLVNIISSLRKACNHPYLFQGAEPEPFSEGIHTPSHQMSYVSIQSTINVGQVIIYGKTVANSI
jgi:SNF2 family DNA or RNA helicase